MHKVILTAVAAAVIAPASAALAAGTRGDKLHAAAGGVEHLTFLSSWTQVKLLDLGDPGFSLGDELIFADNLLTRRNGAKVGAGGGVCTVVHVADPTTFTGTLQCQVTYDLPGGQITAQGLQPTAHLRSPRIESNAITGGTGRFRAVRGQSTTIFLNGDKTAKETFLITH